MYNREHTIVLDEDLWSHHMEVVQLIYFPPNNKEKTTFIQF